IKTLNFDSWKDEPKYEFIKQQIQEKYNASKMIIDAGVQVSGLNEMMVETSKNGLSDVTNDLQTKKDNADKIDQGLFYDIDPTKIKSSTTDNSVSSTDKNNNLYSANSELPFSYSVRKVKDGTTYKVKDNTKFIHSLGGTERKYEFTFQNYSSSNLTLYFVYKIERNPSNNAKYDLQIKVNDQEITATHLDENSLKLNKVNKIYLAKIALTNLNYGDNKIEFIKKNGGYKNVVFGDISLMRAPTEDKELAYFNKLNGQTIGDDGLLTVSIYDAIGGSTQYDSFFEKKSIDGKDHVFLNKVGKFDRKNANYTLVVYAPEAGTYKVSITYEKSSEASKVNIKTFGGNDNNTLQNATGTIEISADSTNTNQVGTTDINSSNLMVNLTKGWNNLVLGEQNQKFPNLEYMYFKKVS
ncbi:hypothetical protein, partial [Mycoplasma bradburyae]|uniref:hypothetical protein n=1 Tax=Mycoplasma bradburyae TaxID=2963128 RepID=UPI002342013D